MEEMNTLQQIYGVLLITASIAFMSMVLFVLVDLRRKFSEDDSKKSN
jgi:hypothetical protein